MNDEDHRKISENSNDRIAALEKQCSALPMMQKQLEDLHRQFLERPPTGEPPLAERVTKAVVAFERGSWLGKFVIWLILGAGSLAAAGTGIINFMAKVGK